MSGYIEIGGSLPRHLAGKLAVAIRESFVSLGDGVKFSPGGATQLFKAAGPGVPAAMYGVPDNLHKVAKACREHGASYDLWEDNRMERWRPGMREPLGYPTRDWNVVLTGDVARSLLRVLRDETVEPGARVSQAQQLLVVHLGEEIPVLPALQQAKETA